MGEHISPIKALGVGTAAKGTFAKGLTENRPAPTSCHNVLWLSADWSCWWVASKQGFILQDIVHMPSCLRSLCFDDCAGAKGFLLPPGSRTPEKFDEDLRALDKLPELRKRFAMESRIFCDPEHPLNKKAKQMGFSKSSGHVGDIKEA